MKTYRVVSVGENNKVQLLTEEGKTFYAYKNDEAQLTAGVSYSLSVFKPQGKNYFTIGDIQAAQPAVLPVQSAPIQAPPRQTPQKEDSKMTKEDWAKKDAGIKWLSCLKSAAELGAAKGYQPEEVLRVAQMFYDYNQESKIDKGVVNAAGQSVDPYAGLR